jgi:DNA-binding transcriptional LysR family regulator
MEWGDIRFLIALQRHGSLAAASRALGVDQTTVGRRLGALESELGTRLFDRHPTGHRLTTAGLRACELGATMESAAEAMERELGGRDTGVEGNVRITAPGGFVPLVVGVLAELRAAHPRLVFHLLVDNASLDLARREADVAVRMVKPEQPTLVARRAGQLPWGLFASEAYLRRRGSPPPDLAGHDVIAYEAPLVRSPGGAWLAEHAREARVALRTNNVLGAVAAAAAGVGVAAVPEFMAPGDVRLTRVRRPREMAASPVFLVAHRDVAKIPRVRATLDGLYRSLRQVMERGVA